MTSQNPPTHSFSGIDYNPSFFSSQVSYITIEEAKKSFLGRTGYPLSIASHTYFDNSVDIYELTTDFMYSNGPIYSNVFNRNLTNDNSGYCELFTNATVDDEIEIGNILSMTTLLGQKVNIPATTTTITNDIFVNTLRLGVGNYVSNTNTCFGKDSMNATNSLGINNTACGNSALKLQAGGANCSAFGSGALATTTAEGNSGFGALAGEKISTGIKNTAVGSASLKGVNSGNRNTGCGNATGQLLTTGTENTLLGYLAGGNITGGSQNTFVGSTVSSGASVNSSSALGAFSGVSTFSNSTAIGGGTSAVTPGAVCTASNQIMLGRSTEFVECSGTDTTNGCLKLNGGLKLQSTYSASPSATMLGYQLTNTTGFTIASFTTATPTNISSAGIALTAGVWNIDYSIELLIATAPATVSAQTLYCSLTTNGAYSTQRISNSGITRIHSTNTYSIADSPCFSGSFNYYVSSATTVFPIFQIAFSAGPTISGVGFYRATRIG